ncbi:hypothetical protein HD554DRAFT_2034478 [Boletus coccyginus]|nr:hypothetical protein HD554DRAFT_2034478 [Boletus coccyginus]
MCGLKIMLGKNEPPVPQAALDLVKVIVDDLKVANKNNKGKGKGTTTGALEAKQIEKKDMKGWMANEKEKNVKHNEEECLKPSIEVKTGKLNTRKQQLVKVGKNEDKSGTDMLHKENSEGGQAIWKMQQLIKICNINIHKITDEESLHFWHQSIDAKSPDATEILGHIIILRSITWLEEGNIATLHDTLQTIGKANMSSLLVQNISGQEHAKLSSGTGVVESDNRTESEGDLNMDQNGNTIIEIGEDICMASQMAPNVEVKLESSGAAQVDGTITHVATVLKCRRSTSIRLFCSKHGGTRKKTRYPNLLLPITRNLLESLTMESIVEHTSNNGNRPHAAFPPLPPTVLSFDWVFLPSSNPYSYSP